MKRTMMAAVFAALGAGTLTVGAMDNVPNMTGSDTFKAMTLDVLNDCGADCSLISYVGTGSAIGELAMLNGTQSVAPMSRALGKTICAQVEPSAAEGIVVAVDGVNIIGNEARVCNSVNGGIEYAATASSSGNAGDRANDWRNALRTIYAGMPTGQDDLLKRDCNSAARRALVASWNNIFKGDCSGKDCNTDTHPSYNGGTPATRYDPFNNVVEPGLRHAFRRDEASGTTDVFLGMLQLPTINFAQLGPQGTTPALSTAQRSAFKALANSPFCNVRRPTDTYPPVTVPSWTNPDGTVKSTFDATQAILSGAAKVLPETISLGVVPAPSSGSPFRGWDHDNNPLTPLQWQVLVPDVYYPEFQDQDPVRRKCVGSARRPDVFATGSEQVCSADAHLGLVLPVNPPPITDLYHVYPTASCTGFAQKPTGVVRPNGVGLLCPDGSPPVGAPPECLMPIIQANGNCECLNRGGAWGDNAAAGEVPIYTALGGPPGSIIDGRVYNLHLRDEICHLRTIGRPNPAAPDGPAIQSPIVGAFYRVHATATLLPMPFGTGLNCQKTDATRQLGCLVQASPCSIGFAGGAAVADNSDLTVNGTADATVGIRVNGLLPSEISGLLIVYNQAPVYPFAHKLYVNTLRGFHNPISGGPHFLDDEQEFVKAFVAGARAGGGSPPWTFGLGPVPFETPFCEDFNENGVCPTQRGCTTAAGRTECPEANTNACADVAVSGIPSGSGSSFCGNEVLEKGEECDDGNLVTDPAVPPADPTDDTCSNLCTVTP